MASKTAPGDLELVRQFVNTFDVETGDEQLGDAEALRRWFEDRGLPGGGDVDEVRAFREALRKLLLANNGEAIDSAAIEILNGAATRAHLRACFDAQGAATLVPAREQPAIGALLAIALRAMDAGTWPRLKACAEHTCEAAFYDSSKNRSGTWCTMRVCGNRTKARNYRRRRANER